jgi:hypothetical protein
VGTQTKSVLLLEGDGLGVRDQKKVPKLKPIGEVGFNTLEGQVLKLIVCEEGTSELVHTTLVDKPPQEVVLIVNTANELLVSC